MWQALEEVALREGLTLSELAQRVDAQRETGQSLSSALRGHAVRYFQEAARPVIGPRPAGSARGRPGRKRKVRG